jgi:citrate lyase subunit beta/citryl-CoA lyase
LDLEDSVPLAEKDAARQTVIRALPMLSGAACTVVRCNPPASEHGQSDLVALAGAPMAGLMVPKCESDLILHSVSQRLPQTALLPIIESAQGYLALSLIANADHVCRLVVGHIDFLADTGMTCSREQVELDSLRFAITMHSRAAQLASAIDGVSVSIDNEPSWREDTERALRFGMGGKLCIHPRQVPAVHAAFQPTEKELIWARSVVAAMNASGGAALQFQGEMIDAPVLMQAQRLLARAR